MKSFYYLSLILSLCVFLNSCRKTNQMELPEDAYLSDLFTNYPDSLAFLLEEQIIPAELQDSDKADYGWWLAQLHQQQGRSLMNDTLIHYTLRYYKEQQSPRLVSTYILAVKQLNWSGNKKEEAEQLIREGIKEFEGKRDTTSAFTLASTLRGYRFLVSKLGISTDVAKKLIFKHTENDIKDRMIAFYSLGCYYGSNEPDSMEHYMKQAIQLSHELKDEKEYYITRNYIDCLSASGQSERALPMLRELERQFPPKFREDSIVHIFAYTCIWLNLGKNDSAKVCLDKLDSYCQLVEDDNHHNEYQTSIGYVSKILRSAYEAKMGQPINMVDIYRFSEVVASKEKNKASIERERLYVQNKLERDNLLLKIKEEQGRQFILYIILIAGCLIATLIYLYQRTLLRKERNLQQAKEQMRLHQITLNENKLIIRQNEDTIQAITSLLVERAEQPGGQEELLAELEQIRLENEQLQKENLSLQEEITKSVQALPNRTAEIETYERMAEQSLTFNQCAKQLSITLIGQHEDLKRLQQGGVKHLSDIDWDSIFSLMDQIFNRYTKRLRTSFPLLTEEDIQCCCLIKLQMSTSAIARLYGIAPSSITKRKQRIKERINLSKIGLLGKDQPVDVYLWGY